MEQYKNGFMDFCYCGQMKAVVPVSAHADHYAFHAVDSVEIARNRVLNHPEDTLFGFWRVKGAA